MTLLRVAMMLLMLQCITGRVDNSETGEATYGANAIENPKIRKEDYESDSVHDVLQQMGIYVDDEIKQKRYDDKKDEAVQSRESESDDIYDLLRARGFDIADKNNNADKNTRKQEVRGVVITGQEDDTAGNDKPINVINNEIYIPKRLWDKYIKEGKIHIINNMINIYLPQPIDVPGGKDEYHANLPSGPMTIQVGAEPATLKDTQMEEGKSVLPSVVLGRLTRRDTTSTSDEHTGTAERDKRSEKRDASEHQKQEEEV
uniref:Uncharacterized protein n=1 Tax=Branchiostoma floridae TaxID=7739 RepID=C3Y4M6_BRAFL|eukprot:XP_002608673.1 hypothetical protein BRAFLDRAFT_73896 [Branchiostoma floridae]